MISRQSIGNKLFQKRVIFRADGSHRLGTGHIMRCLALAQWFKKAGISSVLVAKGYDREIINLSNSYGVAVEIISKKINFAEDALLTVGLANKYGANVIISDMNNALTLARVKQYYRYLQILIDHYKFSIVMDGFGKECLSARVRLPSDITVIPYFGSEGSSYKRYEKSRYLLGLRYFIFREEFARIAGIKRKIRKNANHILVSMGGSDPCKISLKAARALSHINRPFLNLKIVLGAAFKPSDKKELKTILKKFKAKHEIIENCGNISRLMLWSDLAVISGGLTKYETAITGTPALVISYSRAEESIMQGFEKAGSALHLGYAKDISLDYISAAVEGLLRDTVLRSRMSVKARGILDAKGAERIISSIPKELLR